MKKTISINLSGLVFNIEEQAYSVLQVYLDDIRSILSNQDGLEEILEDIESRIAELFAERLSDHKQAITEEDVENVIAIMGNPNQYRIDEDEETSHQRDNQEESVHYTHQKRFFRDDDEGVIGGVAAGLGHYFGIDPVIIRVIFVLMFVLGGSGILLYIILWVVIPEATTTAQKLQMRGQPVNVDSIKNYVHNFKDEAKSGMSNASRSVKNAAKKSTSVFSRLFQIFGRVIGAGMLFFGLIFFVIVILLHFGNIGSFFTVEGDMANNLNAFTDLVFPSGSESLGFWSMFLSIILPIIFITITGAKLLFRIKGKLRSTYITGLIIWIVSICTLSFVGVETGLEFRNDYSTVDKVEQREMFSGDTLFLEMRDSYWRHETFDFGYNDYLLFDDDSLKIGLPLIKVERSLTNTNYEVSVKKRSNGSSLKYAKQKVDGIEYAPILNAEKLIVPSSYSFPTKDKIRGQHASLFISVPVGKRIVFPANMDNFLVEFVDCDHYSDDFLEEPSVWEATEDGMEFVALYRPDISNKAIEEPISEVDTTDTID